MKDRKVIYYSAQLYSNKKKIQENIKSQFEIINYYWQNYFKFKQFDQNQQHSSDTYTPLLKISSLTKVLKS